MEELLYSTGYFLAAFEANVQYESIESIVVRYWIWIDNAGDLTSAWSRIEHCNGFYSLVHSHWLSMEESLPLEVAVYELYTVIKMSSRHVKDVNSKWYLVGLALTDAKVSE